MISFQPSLATFSTSLACRTPYIYFFLIFFNSGNVKTYKKNDKNKASIRYSSISMVERTQISELKL